MNENETLEVFLTVCVGPPQCMFSGEDKLRNLMDGCPLCKHITTNADGTQTVYQVPLSS